MQDLFYKIDCLEKWSVSPKSLSHSSLIIIYSNHITIKESIYLHDKHKYYMEKLIHDCVITDMCIWKFKTTFEPRATAEYEQTDLNKVLQLHCHISILLPKCECDDLDGVAIAVYCSHRFHLVLKMVL